VHQAHGAHCDTPLHLGQSFVTGVRVFGRLTQDHDGRNKDTWSQPLEQDVGKRLKQRIAHKEDGERCIILPIRHLQILLQAIDFRVSNVRPVEKGNQVEEREPWDEFDVEFPEECFVLSQRSVLGEYGETWKENIQQQRAPPH